MLGLDWTYDKHEVAEGSLGAFIDSLDESWRGLSVTMPLKREAFALAASRDAHATYTNAVNTLSFSYEQGRRVARGYNTDVFGIVNALVAAGLGGIDHAVILGAGATAESALVALDELGAGFVTVALRDISKADAIRNLGTRIGMDVRIATLDQLPKVAPAQAVISTIPGSAEVSLASLERATNAVLLDAAYDVWPSPRAVEWVQLGGVTVSGLSMLAFQALKQVRIFVSDSPEAPLPNEAGVKRAMFESVGLNEIGL